MDSFMDAMPTQYADAGGFITTETDDAYSATVFTPGSEVIVHVVRTPRGRWTYDASDFIHPRAALRRITWASADEAIATLLRGSRIRLTVVTDA